MKIYCDGSLIQDSDCAICIAIEGKKPQVMTIEKKKSIHQLEYLAIIWACESASPGSTIISDSKKIVRLLNFKKANTVLQIYYDKAKDLMNEKNLKIIWIPREKNLAGQVLEKRVDKLRDYLGLKPKKHKFK